MEIEWTGVAMHVPMSGEPMGIYQGVLCRMTINNIVCVEEMEPNR